MPAYDEIYIKVRVTTNFLDHKVPKEGVHHICLACVRIDSVIKMGKNIIHNWI